MKRVLTVTVIVMLVLMVAMAVPVSAGPAASPGTLWDKYPGVPSSITFKGTVQYLVAYDAVNREGIWMDAANLSTFLEGQPVFGERGVVSVTDFQTIPAQIAETVYQNTITWTWSA